MFVRLQGRLGNQMFQVAFGKSLAARRYEKVLFTKTCFVGQASWDYLLDGFVTDLEYGQESSLVFKEKACYQYDPTVYDAPLGATFDGFWQSEKYFDDGLVRREFNLRNPLSDESQRTADKIRDVGDKSAFIGIRRADVYGSIPNLSLDLSYYTTAIDYIRQRCEGVKFFIVTDSPEWSQEQFPDCILFNPTPWQQKYEDMYLMSLCRHAIISNGTFHWWGCWLGDTQLNRICIAPSRWAARGHEINSQHRDIIPARWIELAETL